MPLTETPDIICKACFAHVTVEELVKHPTVPYAYLDLCQTCLVTEALAHLAAGAKAHRRVA
jgi:hypothetical protein